MLEKFRRALGPGLLKPGSDTEISEEIQLYLDLRAKELEEQGLSPEEAQRTALAAFGSPEAITRRVRRQDRRATTRKGWGETMSSAMQDFRQAFRGFKKNPAFAVVAVLTLAIGIGANTAIFSVVDAALIRGLPFEDSDRLIFINGYREVDGQPSIRGASYPEFRDWKDRARTVEDMATLSGLNLTLTGDGTARQLAAEFITVDYFRALGVEPARGRTFLPEEDRTPDTHPVIVVSHRLWKDRLGSDPTLLGRALLLNDRPMTVVGIMPEGFEGVGLNTDVWITSNMIGLSLSATRLELRDARSLSVVARLASGVSMEEAQADLNAIAAALEVEYPIMHEARGAQVQSFRDGYMGNTANLLWVLLGAGGVLLLIACANVTNLLIVRSYARSKEIVLRRALGAGRGRIVRQLLTESVALAVMGAGTGLLLAYWSVHALVPMIPGGVLPGYVDVTLNPKVFLFTLAVLTLAGTLSGLVPAFSGTSMGLAQALREGAKSVAGGRNRRLRAHHVFVVTEVALALILLVGAGLMTRSFRAQANVDTGLAIDEIHAFRLQFASVRYPETAQIIAFSDELTSRIEALPGVTGAVAASDLPLRGRSSAGLIWREGDLEHPIRYHRHYVGPDYFNELGIALRQGRGITTEDTQGSPAVAVISAAMAERVFPGENPLGRRLYTDPSGEGRSLEIVGVAEDVRHRNLTTDLLAEANSPDVYRSLAQSPRTVLEIAVRAPTALASLPASILGIVTDMDPSLAVIQMSPLSAQLALQTAQPRFGAFLLGVFSLVALMLACVGIYGVLAFSVGQRSREIAVRRAIGATAWDVAGSVIGDGLKLATVGLLLGGVAALFSSRLLQAFLFEVEATDPATFGVVLVVLTAVSLIATAVPAYRASRRDPNEALNAN